MRYHAVLFVMCFVGGSCESAEKTVTSPEKTGAAVQADGCVCTGGLDPTGAPLGDVACKTSVCDAEGNWVYAAVPCSNSGTAPAPSAPYCASGYLSDGTYLGLDASDGVVVCGSNGSGPEQFICNAGTWVDSGPCASSSCTNQQWDPGENETDCGGVCSGTCVAGQHCTSDADCASGTCTNSVCQ